MVKFRVYWVKKAYKHGNRMYKYRGIMLRLPKIFHNKIDPFIGQTLEMRDVLIHETADQIVIDIVLSKKKKGINLLSDK